MDEGVKKLDTSSVPKKFAGSGGVPSVEPSNVEPSSKDAAALAKKVQANAREATAAPRKEKLEEGAKKQAVADEKKPEPSPKEGGGGEDVPGSLGKEDVEPKKGEKGKPVRPSGQGQEEGGKKAKKAKKGEHHHVSLREIPAFIFPQHIGDIFVVLMVLAMAIGAAIFWFLAWIPSNDVPLRQTQDNIQQFSDTELQEIITILDNREEASKAPVITPARDPFHLP